MPITSNKKTPQIVQVFQDFHVEISLAARITIIEKKKQSPIKDALRMHAGPCPCL
jgi:hypothetical protein